MKKLVLIDSNALVHRAFHALPPLTSPKGKPTNAVYGFTTVLLKMLGDLKPDYIAAAFDLAGPTFRHKQFKQYKAHRIKAPDELYAQIPVVKQVLSAFGIPVYEQAGFEADDIIGTLAEKAKTERDLQTIIVTGDLDTLQLVDKDRVVVFTLRKGMSDTVTYNERQVKARFGLAPSQVTDFKGLKGDPSDNIPGVPGVGEKTASALIGQFGSVEKLYSALEGPGTRKGKSGVSEKLKAKLLEHKAQAFSSKELTTIVRNVPVNFDLAAADWRARLDMSALKTLCQDLGFYSLVKRLDRSLGDAVPTPPQLDLDATLPSRVHIRAVHTAEELLTAPELAVHAIVKDGALAAVCTCSREDEVLALETSDTGDLAVVLEKSTVVVAHDAKLLLKLAGRTGLACDAWVDTHIAAWLVNPDLRDYSLERVAYDHGGQYLETDERTWASAIFRLKTVLTDALAPLKLAGLFRNMEMPLVSVLARMEERGITVDPAVLAELATEARAELASLQRRIFKHAGEEFNINSPQQLGRILFEKLAIRGRVKRTATGGISTAAGELDRLREEHPVIELILQWRELSKLAGTYIEPFPSLIAGDGRIHTTYNQTGTATGRLSSQDPNLQNIPTRTELGRRFRAAFVAARGSELLSLDYSQIELRIVAHLAQDKVMTEVFKRGEDIHARTASVVFGVPQEEVTAQMRRQAKVLNFGIIYGMGVVGFARAAGVSRDEARRFMDDYFARFSGVARYMEETKQLAARQGFVTTILGRRRPLPDITSRMPQLAAQAERMAINHPVQGTDADIMKLAMLAVDRHLGSRYGPEVSMLLQIHDELVLEVPTGLVAQVAAQAKELMEQAYPLSVPLVVDAKHGRTWAGMEPLKL